MSVVKSAFTVGAFTLFSRLSGFVRECVMAFCLGAGVYTDALLIALRIANTFRRIFAEGAFNASFLPRFSKILNTEGQDKANVVLVDVFSILLIILVLFSIIVIVFFPSVLQVLVSGFDVLSYKFGLTVTLGRVCFPYLIFISLTSLFCGVLNTINKFALPAAAYSLLSIFTTIGILVGYLCDLDKGITVYIVAWCAVLSGIVQSLLLYLSICKYGFSVFFRLNCFSKQVKDIMKNMMPGIIGAGVWQLNLLVDTTIASYMPTGTITCINLADRINQFPLGTLGIALSTALLPNLSKYISKNEHHKAANALKSGLLFAFFLTFFSTALLIALSEESVAVAFQRGLFGQEHVAVTSSAVMGFAIGLPAYVLTKIFSSVYFATGDTKTPVFLGVISVVLNVIFLLLIVPFLKYFGLALCTSLSSISNAILLIYFSKGKLQIKYGAVFWKKICSQFVAALVSYIVLIKLSSLYWYPDIGMESKKWGVYMMFFVAGAISFFVTSVLCLRMAKYEKWKLWKKEAW